MTKQPWWVERVERFLEPGELGRVALGALFRLHEELRFVRDNVELLSLPVDFARAPETDKIWRQFLAREHEVRDALDAARDEVRGRIAGGTLVPAAFRALWQGLGFAPNARDAGTPADDYLDGIFADASCADAPLPALGNPNMASRAALTADFLRAIEPGADDVVLDLGSGTGKLALTVSTSTISHVVGVECCGDYVSAARALAGTMSLDNLRFDHADARDVDLAEGSVFYLYHPFRGEVARCVAERLGALARKKDIRIFTSGPLLGYGEFFLREVEKGNLALREHRGEFSQVMVLGSEPLSAP